jgi:hypothetical protein
MRRGYCLAATSSADAEFTPDRRRLRCVDENQFAAGEMVFPMVYLGTA